MLRRLALAGSVAVVALGGLQIPASAAPRSITASPNRVSFRSPVGFNNAEFVTITNKTNTNFTAGIYQVGSAADGFSLDTSNIAPLVQGRRYTV